MRRLIGVLATTAVATGLAVVGVAAPAGAAISTGVAGTVLTVSLTGVTTVTFGCTGGSVDINGTIPSPTLPCNTVTKVQVNGDSSDQNVYGYTLDEGFAANPFLGVNLGAGSDYVIETKQADVIQTGADLDTIELRPPGTPNTTLDAGSGTDYVYAYGSSGADTFTLSAAGATGTLVTNVGGVGTTYSVSNIEAFVLRTNEGADDIKTGGVEVASAVDYVQAEGGDGDDTLTAGPNGVVFWGDAGTNTLTGGPGNDTFYSFSSTDVIKTGAGTNTIYDRNSLKSGSRTIDSDGQNYWFTYAGRNDAVIRVRPGSAPGTTLVTGSLSRPGQQVLPSSFQGFTAALTDYAAPYDRGLADVIPLAGNRSMTIYGDLPDDDLADITVPEGGWTVTGTPGDSLNVSTDSAAYGNVSLGDIVTYSVHGPWTNKNRGFVHRAHRDLLFRFASTATLDEGQAFLGDGTLTRPQVVASLMDTDEYRGLDVDRVFIRYLRRAADAGGRTYWINRLGEGRALWRFRAQLFGGNEYFTKAGGTNALYVNRAYQDVLGRAPDPSGQTYWTNKLNNGADRGAVALQFINSAEARRRLVDDQFLRFLDRYPTLAEQNTWVARIPGNTGEQDLIAFLATSAAYYARD